MLAYLLLVLSLTLLITLFIVGYMKKWVPAAVFFLVLAAAAMVYLRLILFDRAYFDLSSFPNHDMLQGFPLFSSSLHSMRLSGDIAWWYSPSLNGYAQYYLSFLSPMAPTSGSPVFFVWMQIVRLLSMAGITLPEYMQYLAVNYLVLPFLTFITLGYLAQQLFTSRWTILLVLIVYTLSGASIWNGSWFYFQESFSLFWLAGSFLALCRQPSARTVYFFGFAAVNQIASFNYWTVFNIPFILIFGGIYVAIYRSRLRYTWRTLRRMPRLSQLILSLIIACAVLWGCVVVLVYMEQGSQYFRRDSSIKDLVILRPLLRMLTLDLFMPSFSEVVQLYNYPYVSPVHLARYLGAFLVPLLALIPWVGNRHRIQWFLFSALLVLAFCFGPILLTRLLAQSPQFTSIIHLFRFYNIYLQLMLLFMAAAILDVLITQPLKRLPVLRIKQVMAVISGVCLSLLAMQLFMTPAVQPEVISTTYEAPLAILLRLLIPGGLIYLALAQRPLAPRSWLGLVFVIVALLDLSEYYQAVNKGDNAYTQSDLKIVMTDPAALQIVFPPPDLNRGFKQAPLDTARLFPEEQLHLWTNNHFNWHIHFIELVRYLKGGCGDVVTCVNPVYDEQFAMQTTPPSPLVAYLFADAPLEFFTEAQTVVGADMALLDGAIEQQQPLLLLNSALPVPEPVENSVPAAIFTYAMQDWNYNAATFEVTAPSAGYLLIRQIYDRNRSITVDGQPVPSVPADVVGTAIPIPAGTHLVKLEYLPLSRQIYWSAVTVTELLIVVVIGLWWRSRSRRAA